MAFKIDTQMQTLAYGNKSNTEAKPGSKPKPITNSDDKIHTRPSFPNQNLINKYKAPEIFINAQNNIGNKLGIQDIITPQREKNIGKDILLEFLKSQNSSLEFLNKAPKLSFQESLELEKSIQEMAQKGE